MTFRASGGMREEEKGVGESYLVIEPLRLSDLCLGSSACGASMIFPAPPHPTGWKWHTWPEVERLDGSPGRVELLVPTVPTSQSGAEFWAVWWGSWPPLEPLSFLLRDVADLPRV